MNKSDELKQQAIAHGLCEQWQNEWGNDLTDQELIDRYIRGIDFAIANDWPSVEYIKSHFDADILHKNGIWCSDGVTEKNKVMVLNGNCTGHIIFSKFDVATVYVRHGSKVRITAKDFARVRVCLYDKCDVFIVNNSASELYIYRHDTGCKMQTYGNIIIRRAGNN